MSKTYKSRNSKSNASRGSRNKDVKDYTVKRSNNKYSADDNFTPSKATNNPNWYALDPALLRDAASLPFSRAVGTPISLHNKALEALSTQEFTIPGIMEFKIAPSFGFSKDAYSPLNTAAFGVYTFVRHQNSGHANYDAPDLMLYLCAMTQVYSYINFLQRAYGVVTTYAQKNRYLPDVLLRTMGIDFDSLRNNLAQFRYGINALINKAASLCVPSVMPIFVRMASIYTNVYIEGDTMKDQLYLYNPYGFHKYTLDESGAGKLEFIPLGDGVLADYQSLLSFGNDMLARLIMSEDINIMSGDILKAYGSGNLIKLAPLPEYYNIVPIADIAVLNQMKNTNPIDKDLVTYSSMGVTQDPTRGWLIHKPMMYYTYTEDQGYSGAATAYLLQTYAEDKILTVKSVDPTPAEVMEYTRGMIIGSDYIRDAENKVASMYIETGCDICVGCHIWSIDKDGAEWVPHRYQVPYAYIYNASDEDSNVNAIRAAALASNFRFHAPIRMCGFKQSSSNPAAFNITHVHTMLDVDNYTTIAPDTLKSMHETALLSLFAVPTLTKSK